MKSPCRANKHDAGTDFFVPEFTEEFIAALKEKNINNNLIYEGSGDKVEAVIIPPHEQINIPSGIRVWIYDKSTYLQATNKSGIASKFHLDVMANTIDADYCGELHLNLSNNGNNRIVILPGMKIVQFIHREYIDTEWIEETAEEYEAHGETDRGAGGFGSTGI